MAAGVYIHTSPYGKRYVGQSWDLGTRHGGNWLIRYKGCTSFLRAIKKFGRESFTTAIVATVPMPVGAKPSAQEQAALDALEQHWIAEFKTTDKRFGYNLKSGGSHGQHAEETKRRIGVLSKKKSAEAFAKMHRAGAVAARARMADPVMYGKQVELLKNVRDLAKAWHASEVGREAHKRIGAMTYKAFVPVPKACKQCSKEFTPNKIGNLDDFCSNACKSAFRRASGIDNVKLNCPECGKQFMRNKYAKPGCCSIACANRVRARDKVAKRASV